MTEPEQAVIIRVPISSQLGQAEEIQSIHGKEREIAEVLRREKVGELDGDEFGGGICLIYLYGEDADRIFVSIKAILTSWQALKCGTVTRRYGPPGSEENLTRY